jgi:hypothetical protein
MNRIGTSDENDTLPTKNNMSDSLLSVTKTNQKSTPLLPFQLLIPSRSRCKPTKKALCSTMIFEGRQFHSLASTEHPLPTSGLTTSISMQTVEPAVPALPVSTFLKQLFGDKQFLLRRSTPWPTTLIQDEKSICNDRVKGLASTDCTIINSIYLLRY